MKLRHILIAAAVLVALAAAAVIRVATVRTTTTESQRIYLPEGTTYAALCDTLQCHHAVRNMLWFHLMAKVRGLQASAPCGSYLLQPGTTQLALVQKLSRRQQDPIRLTIGKHRLPADLQAYLGSHLMHHDFDIDTAFFAHIRPDTYEVYWTITPDQFRQRMEREYAAFWRANCGGTTQSRSQLLAGMMPPLTADEVIILASIVDEETNATAEKPLIASVYLNRLRLGMPLQADPTVKYAVGDFSLRRILNQHLLTPSPYNTYLHTGLPPAPICLPSASSIDAVLRAPQTKYLYFCASDAMDGTHRFAATLAEHNRNAEAFHRALNRRGIR